jgi:hypothetical protein
LYVFFTFFVLNISFCHLLLLTMDDSLAECVVIGEYAGVGGASHRPLFF